MPEPELHSAAEPSEGSDSDSPEARIAELERRLAQQQGREEGWREERRRLLAALDEAERELAELPAMRAELQASREAAYWLAAIQSSWTYRVAEPVRAAGRRLRGRRGG